LAEIASLDLQNLQLDFLRANLDSRLRKDVVERLHAAGKSAALREIQEAESLYQAALNRRESLLQKLNAIGLNAGQIEQLLQEDKLVERLPLRAPIGGAVIQFNKVLGQSVKAQEPLFAVHDLTQVWVQGYLFEQDIVRVRTGQKVRVRLVADPQFLAEGTIVRSGHAFGAEDRTLSVWIELKETPKQPLPYNLSARLTVTLGRLRPVLAVPSESLVSDGLRSYLFVRRLDETFERRLVQTGRADDRFIEISSGLEAGEPIAVRGATQLQTAYASLR